MSLKRSDFNYKYNEEDVAQEASSQRVNSKLFIYRNNLDSSPDEFKNIVDHLPKNCLIVRNNTKVFPSRVIAYTPHGGKVELFLLTQKTNPLSPFQNESWDILARPMKKLSPGVTLNCEGGLKVTVIDKSESSANGPQPAKVKLSLKGEELQQWLDTYGVIPLPPYIKRDVNDLKLRKEDQERYQTSFAKYFGSVAAPTAGLHFTDEIDRCLKESGIGIVDLTLHVGAGTFLPVKTDNPEDHIMHEEMYYISHSSMEKIIQAKSEGRPIIVVGTTSMRSLESIYKLSKKTGTPIIDLTDQWHGTNLFIYPKDDNDKYAPYFASGIITNFHQPESTLFMLISALIGRHNAIKFYEESIKKGARLFSYGDSSLLFFN